MSYKIDNDVPFDDTLPPRPGRPARFPFGDLEINGSFFVPSVAQYITGEPTLLNALYKARDHFDRNFVWRKEDGGWRIFRRPGNSDTNRPDGRPYLNGR